MLIEHVLQADDDALKVRLAALTNVVADLAQIDIVQSSINFVHDKERSRMVRMNCKKESQGSYGLFSATQLLHVAESLHRWHRIELETALVRLFGVVETKVRIAAQWMLATLGHVSVDSLERFVDMLKGFIEALSTLGLDTLKRLSSLGCIVFGLLVVRTAFFEAVCDCRESIARLLMQVQGEAVLGFSNRFESSPYSVNLPSC